MLSELLSDLDLHHPPCANLNANRSFYTLAVLAWNLLQALKLLHLPREEAPKRMRTLLRHLLLIPVELKRHARQTQGVPVCAGGLGGVVARIAGRVAAALSGVGRRGGERVGLKIGVDPDNRRSGSGRETATETEEVCSRNATVAPPRVRNSPASDESGGNHPPAHINFHRAATAIFKTPLSLPTRSVGKD